MRGFFLGSRNKNADERLTVAPRRLHGTLACALLFGLATACSGADEHVTFSDSAGGDSSAGSSGEGGIGMSSGGSSSGGTSAGSAGSGQGGAAGVATGGAAGSNGSGGDSGSSGSAGAGGSAGSGGDAGSAAGGDGGSAGAGGSGGNAGASGNGGTGDGGNAGTGSGGSAGDGGSGGTAGSGGDGGGGAGGGGAGSGGGGAGGSGGAGGAPNGDPCTTPGECASGRCVDGVCCNTPCSGGCNACDVPGSEGTCTVLVADTVCRAKAGPCDVEEVCNGTSAACPADARLSASSVCRPLTGGCDVEEFCDGATVACPGNGLAPIGATCRASAGRCDVAETCSGTSAACPSDQLAAAGDICRASAGACDADETCSGSSPQCPTDAKVPAGTSCRASAGGCDIEETCNGVANTCPVDRFVAMGVQCRASAGVCDAVESCSGASAACPADTKVPANTICRQSAGACDAAERCNGASNACPSDARANPSTVCRPAAGGCDIQENCDGTSVDCPDDDLRGSGAVCRAVAGGCDVAETCSGSSAACPADAVLPSPTVCRAAGGVCDVAETCDGGSPACPADTLITGDTCRASAGDCDLEETCNGANPACPADAKVAQNTECRAVTGVCDAAEVCNGVAATCPSDSFLNGVVCRSAVSICDAAESCTGSTSDCPADAFANAGSECRPSAGPCDVAERCTGDAGTCPADDSMSQACSAACGATGGCGFTDTDLDGLNDTWETNGYIDNDCSGTNNAGDTPLPNADPLKPNVYVKWDYMVKSGADAHSHRPSNAAMTLVQDAFKLQDVILTFYPSSDAITETNVVSIEDPGNIPACAGPSAVSLYTLKAAHFPAELAPAYHYALFAHHNTCPNALSCAACPATAKSAAAPPFGTTGIAERPGNDLIVSFGAYIEAFTTIDDQMNAGTFLHELGHNLGLQHGGGDSITGKPNYFSAMNPSYQFGIYQSAAPGPFGTTPDPTAFVGRRVDLSANVLGTLHEGQLFAGACVNDGSGGMNELTGITLNSLASVDVTTFYGLPGPTVLFAPSNGTPVNWNNIPPSTQPSVFGDVSGDGQCDVLTGYADWAQTNPAPGVTQMTHLSLDFQCNTGFWQDGRAWSDAREDAELALADDVARGLSVNRVRAELCASCRAPGRAEPVVVVYGDAALGVEDMDFSSLRLGGARAASTELVDVDGDGRVDLAAAFELATPPNAELTLTGLAGETPFGALVRTRDASTLDLQTHASEPSFESGGCRFSAARHRGASFAGLSVLALAFLHRRRRVVSAFWR